MRTEQRFEFPRQLPGDRLLEPFEASRVEGNSAPRMLGAVPGLPFPRLFLDRRGPGKIGLRPLGAVAGAVREAHFEAEPVSGTGSGEFLASEDLNEGVEPSVFVRRPVGFLDPKERRMRPALDAESGARIEEDDRPARHREPERRGAALRRWPQRESDDQPTGETDRDERRESGAPHTCMCRSSPMRSLTFSRRESASSGFLTQWWRPGSFFSASFSHS